MSRTVEAAKAATTAPRRVREYEEMKLEREYSWLRTLAHISPVAMYRVDAEGRFTYVNEAWCQLAGMTSKQAMGQSWEKGLVEEDVPLVSNEWHRSLVEKVPFRLEYRYRQASGRIVWVLGQVTRELDGEGRALGYVGTLTDITELRQMRVELEHSHTALEERMEERAMELQRMATIVEMSDDAIISSDLDGLVVSWNQGAENLFGYTAREMIGQTSFVVTPEDKTEEARSLKAQVRQGEAVLQFETVRRAKSGAQVEVSLSLIPLRNVSGSVIGTSAIVRDITARNEAQRSLRQLSWHLLKVQDDERRRIARYLHDSTAQTVAALAMNLALLAREDPACAPQRRRELLAQCQELADGAAEELRTHSYLLHPPLLEERGLVAALQWFVEGFRQRKPRVDVTLDIDPQLSRLSPEAEMALFRVVQECFTDVLAHSLNLSIKLQLARAGAWVILEVRGRGRNPGPAPQGEISDVGITTMKERLLQLGGSLSISPKQSGATVVARAPTPKKLCMNQV